MGLVIIFCNYLLHSVKWHCRVNAFSKPITKLSFLKVSNLSVGKSNYVSSKTLSLDQCHCHSFNLLEGTRLMLKNKHDKALSQKLLKDDIRFTYSWLPIVGLPTSPLSVQSACTRRAFINTWAGDWMAQEFTNIHLTLRLPV